VAIDECEYQWFVMITHCLTIEALDAALEEVFKDVFGTDDALSLNPVDVSLVRSSSETKRRACISGMEENIRHVVIEDPHNSPKRRFLDAILEVYGNQYELLVKNQVDKLTGLFNRQLLDEKISRLSVSQEIADRRKNEPVRMIVIVDIDHFKGINDKFGHLYGDEVLVLISHMMKQAFRTDDWLFRYGGEELLIFLNNIDVGHARSAINRFLLQVENYEFPQIGRATVSCGFTLYDSTQDFSVIFDRADKALYYSKNNGRTQASFYEDLVADNKIETVERKNIIDLF